MEKITRQAHNLLLKLGKTLAVAESCTGGLVSESLTRLPGASAYFILGLTPYSNKTKISLLKVPAKVLAKYGAVSEETALAMAQNIRSMSKTDFGIGVTGIAGPSGGTPEKPVGTVFIAVAEKTEKICKRFLFKGSRQVIRKKTALKAIRLLLLLLSS